MERQTVIQYLDETPSVPCPFGEARRVITGGAGGVANLHHITVTEGAAHFHEGYDEVYFVLAGAGEITIDGDSHELRPGAAVVIPRGAVHSLRAQSVDPLEFLIFGSPAMGVDDARFVPRRPVR